MNLILNIKEIELRIESEKLVIYLWDEDFNGGAIYIEDYPWDKRLDERENVKVLEKWLMKFGINMGSESIMVSYF